MMKSFIFCHLNHATDASYTVGCRLCVPLETSERLLWIDIDSRGKWSAAQDRDASQKRIVEATIYNQCNWQQQYSPLRHFLCIRLFFVFIFWNGGHLKKKLLCHFQLDVLTFFGKKFFIYPFWIGKKNNILMLEIGAVIILRFINSIIIKV